MKVSPNSTLLNYLLDCPRFLIGILSVPWPAGIKCINNSPNRFLYYIEYITCVNLDKGIILKAKRLEIGRRVGFCHFQKNTHPKNAQVVHHCLRPGS